MKRRTFLASIAALIAAPFVVKSKPKTIGIFIAGRKVGECNNLEPWEKANPRLIDEFESVNFKPYRMRSNIVPSAEMAKILEMEETYKKCYG